MRVTGLSVLFYLPHLLSIAAVPVINSPINFSYDQTKGTTKRANGERSTAGYKSYRSESETSDYNSGNGYATGTVESGTTTGGNDDWKTATSNPKTTPVAWTRQSSSNPKTASIAWTRQSSSNPKTTMPSTYMSEATDNNWTAIFWHNDAEADRNSVGEVNNLNPSSEWINNSNKTGSDITMNTVSYNEDKTTTIDSSTHLHMHIEPSIKRKADTNIHNGKENDTNENSYINTNVTTPYRIIMKKHPHNSSKPIQKEVFVNNETHTSAHHTNTFPNNTNTFPENINNTSTHSTNITPLNNTQDTSPNNTNNTIIHETTDTIPNNTIIHEITDTIPNNINDTTLYEADRTVTHDYQPKCDNEVMRLSFPSQSTKLVCFITLWALSVIASIFFGLTVFLWVRLSLQRKREKGRRERRGEKRGEKGNQGEAETLWVQQEGTVEERVEFWYANGSSVGHENGGWERRNERRRVEECEAVWVQPKVTLEEITEFLVANRRVRQGEERDWL